MGVTRRTSIITATSIMGHVSKGLLLLFHSSLLPYFLAGGGGGPAVVLGNQDYPITEPQIAALVNFAEKCDYSRFPSFETSICRPPTAYPFCWSWENDPQDFFYLGYSSTEPPVLWLEYRLLKCTTDDFSVLGEFPDLSKLNIRDTLVVGNWPSLLTWNMTGLDFLDVSENALHGNLPTLPELWPPNLKTIYAHSTFMSGSLPEALFSLTLMEVCDLSRNNFTGSIPLNFLTGNPLEILDLSDNRLQGAIPNIASSSVIRELHIDFNQLEGEIPSLLSLEHLQELTLDYNKLAGSIPSFPPELEVFKARDNWLGGNLPALSGLSHLKTLDIGNNMIEGAIPDWAASGDLEFVNLESNKFAGDIPDLSSLVNLVTFKAGSNLLEGTIPNLSGLTRLLIFDVSDNRLSGKLPLLPDTLGLANFFGEFNIFECPLPAMPPGSNMYDTAHCVCKAGFYGGGVPEPDCLSSAAMAQNETLLELCLASGRYTCEMCPPGHFTSDPWSETCSPCLPGSFSETDASIGCEACPAGTFQDNPGASNCTACPVGTVQPYQNSISCVSCQPGSFASIPGSTTCDLCPPGTNQSSPAASTCEPCPDNFYQENEGSLQCYPCPVYSFTLTPGASECTPCNADTSHLGACRGFCEPGYFFDTSSSAEGECSQCPIGTHALEAGAREGCTPCAPGTYSDSAGASVCEMCASGTYQDISGASTCRLCSPGWFQPSQMATECLACDAGSYSLDGATACSVCAPGTAQISSTSSSCLLCPINTFQAEPGATECTPCPQHSFTNSMGSKDCTPCDDTTGLEEACRGFCLIGYGPGTSTTNGGGDVGECTKCPVGSYSLGGGDPCITCPSQSDDDDDDDDGSSTPDTTDNLTRFIITAMCHSSVTTGSSQSSEGFSISSMAVGGITVGAIFVCLDRLRSRYYSKKRGGSSNRDAVRGFTKQKNKGGSKKSKSIQEQKKRNSGSRGGNNDGTGVTVENPLYSSVVGFGVEDNGGTDGGCGTEESSMSYNNKNGNNKHPRRKKAEDRYDAGGGVEQLDRRQESCYVSDINNNHHGSGLFQPIPQQPVNMQVQQESLPPGIPNNNNPGSSYHRSEQMVLEQQQQQQQMGPNLVGEWVEAFDESTQRVYYYNASTGDVTWG